MHFDWIISAKTCASRKAIFHAGFSDQGGCYLPDSVHVRFGEAGNAVERLSRFRILQESENKNPLLQPLLAANFTPPTEPLPRHRREARSSPRGDKPAHRCRA